MGAYLMFTNSQKIVFFVIFSLFGCEFARKDESRTREFDAQKNPYPLESIQVAEGLYFGDNLDRENVQKRLDLTSNPETVGFIVLLNETGMPVYQAQVKGKISSNSKRLKSKYIGGTHDDPSDEGIFFWTPSGQYIQWNGRYLYSNQPFRLTIRPLLFDLTSGGVDSDPDAGTDQDSGGGFPEN